MAQQATSLQEWDACSCQNSDGRALLLLLLMLVR
jgi:hypothetical protein